MILFEQYNHRVKRKSMDFRTKRWKTSSLYKRVLFIRIHRDCGSTATSRQDNHARHRRTTLPVAAGREGPDGRWKDTAQGSASNYYSRMFTDERKRLNGQVGRENDDASFLSLILTSNWFVCSTGCPKTASTSYEWYSALNVKTIFVERKFFWTSQFRKYLQNIRVSQMRNFKG